MTKRARIPERAWTDQLLALAKIHGWVRAHFRPARVKDPRTGRETWRTPVQGDGAGFPDLLLLRGDRLVVAELKSDEAPRELPAAQAAWLHAFELVGAETYAWRPSDLDAANRVLSRRRPA